MEKGRINHNRNRRIAVAGAAAALLVGFFIEKTGSENDHPTIPSTTTIEFINTLQHVPLPNSPHDTLVVITDAP